MLYFIVYSSHSKKKFTIQELSDLWKKSVKNNISLGITGILIHLNERFIQLLEGEKTIVEELYGKIVKDERHNDVTKLLKGTLKNRNYENWQMGYHSYVDNNSILLGAGSHILNQIDNKIITQSDHPSLHFLKMFYLKHYIKNKANNV